MYIFKNFDLGHRASNRIKTNPVWLRSWFEGAIVESVRTLLELLKCRVDCRIMI